MLLSVVVVLFQFSSVKAWDFYLSNDGEFEVLFPEDPAYSLEEVDSPVGILIMHSFSASAGEDGCVVMHCDYPISHVVTTSIEAMFQGAIEGVLNGFGGYLLDQSDIFFDNGYPSQRVRIGTTVEGVSFQVHIYYSLVGRRLYQLLYVTERREAEVEEISTFLESLQVYWP